MDFEESLKRLLWWWSLFGTLLWVIWRLPLGRGAGEGPARWRTAGGAGG